MNYEICACENKDLITECVIVLMLSLLFIFTIVRFDNNVCVYKLHLIVYRCKLLSLLIYVSYNSVNNVIVLI